MFSDEFVPCGSLIWSLNPKFDIFAPGEKITCNYHEFDPGFMPGVAATVHEATLHAGSP